MTATEENKRHYDLGIASFEAQRKLSSPDATLLAVLLALLIERKP